MNYFMQYVVGSFACIGGGLFGLDISSMSGVLNVSDIGQVKSAAKLVTYHCILSL